MFANQVDALRIDAFCFQIDIRVGGRRQQDVGEAVGDDAVDLFRHRPIETAEPGFEVSDGDQQLRRHQRRGHGRVHIAGGNYEIRFFGEADFLESDHHLGRLHRVRRRSDIQITIRRGRPSSRKKPFDMASS